VPDFSDRLIFPTITGHTLYKIIYTVPPSHLAATKSAIFNAGGGSYAEGKLHQCVFETTGYGKFKPVFSAGAVPHTGTVDPVIVEIRCEEKEVTRKAVEALRSSSI